MGCDWYTFTTIIGKGTVETVQGDDNVPGGENVHVFRKDLLSNVGGKMSMRGTIDYSDEIWDEGVQIVVVQFSEVENTETISVPGPYEIEEHQVIITQLAGGRVLLMTTR